MFQGMERSGDSQIMRVPIGMSQRAIKPIPLLGISRTSKKGLVLGCGGRTGPNVGLNSFATGESWLFLLDDTESGLSFESFSEIVRDCWMCEASDSLVDAMFVCAIQVKGAKIVGDVWCVVDRVKFREKSKRFATRR